MNINHILSVLDKYKNEIKNYDTIVHSISTKDRSYTYMNIKRYHLSYWISRNNVEGFIIGLGQLITGWILSPTKVWYGPIHLHIIAELHFLTHIPIHGHPLASIIKRRSIPSLDIREILNDIGKSYPEYQYGIHRYWKNYKIFKLGWFLNTIDMTIRRKDKYMTRYFLHLLSQYIHLGSEERRTSYNENGIYMSYFKMEAKKYGSPMHIAFVTRDRSVYKLVRESRNVTKISIWRDPRGTGKFIADLIVQKKQIDNRRIARSKDRKNIYVLYHHLPIPVLGIIRRYL